MGKWYDKGFKEGQRGLPSDPPYQRGNKHYAEYEEGWNDGNASEALLDRMADNFEGEFDD